MSKRRRKRHVHKTGRESSKKTSPGSNMIEIEDFSKQQRYFEFFIIAILFIFGIYQSVLYFGHQLIPNPDFTGFVRTGRELLSFQIPSSFKRTPVLGMLQVCLSHIVGGSHPDLTAGWLLNAILHPFNAILIYLIGKKIIGKSALWIAVIVIINPWVLALLTHPIAETTLLFFVLLTFYFIFKRSNWCYLFASITTMVRYDGAALIVVAFIINIILSKNKKERILTVAYAAIATIPLILWMLGTMLNFQSEGSTHYLKELGLGGAIKDSLIRSLGAIWQSGFYSLFVPKPTAAKDTVETLMNLSKILVSVSFIFGSIYGLCKRNWRILALLLFLVQYIMVHVIHSYLISRFCTTILWIPMLICLYGLQSIWQIINKDQRVPKVITIILYGILLVLAFIWWVGLVPYLPKIAVVSRQSASLPYVAMGVVAVIFAARRFIYKLRYSWRDLAISMLICLIVVSNQFILVRVLENGQKDIEFKYLADWYVAHAKPDEKMVTGMANIVSILIPEHEDSLIHLSSIRAESPDDFVKKCYDKNVTYVVWDSRIGLVRNRWYKLYKYQHVAMLAKPQSIGPYKYLFSIRINERRFLNIFRLQKKSFEHRRQ